MQEQVPKWAGGRWDTNFRTSDKKNIGNGKKQVN